MRVLRIELLEKDEAKLRASLGRLEVKRDAFRRRAGESLDRRDPIGSSLGLVNLTRLDVQKGWLEMSLGRATGDKELKFRGTCDAINSACNLVFGYAGIPVLVAVEASIMLSDRLHECRKAKRG